MIIGYENSFSGFLLKRNIGLFKNLGKSHQLDEIGIANRVLAVGRSRKRKPFFLHIFG